jgi:hypothetical protein
MTAMTASAAWHQRPDERPHHYEAFQCYVQKQSIEAAYKEYEKKQRAKKGEKSGAKKANGKSSGSFRTWAKLFDWDNRLRAYNDYIESKRTQAHVVEMEKFHEQRGKLYREMAAETHEQVKKKMKMTEDVPLSHYIQAAQYYDNEYLAHVEREAIAGLQERMMKENT